MAATLSPVDAAEFYDRFGAKQDSQAFYEDPATDRLVEYAGFDRAKSVVEFGCGTGRFACRLLQDLLPDDSRYVGFDASQTMIGLARERIAPWSKRAEVRLTDGSTALDLPETGFDRFVANYVLDLMSDEAIRQLLGVAHRCLEPGGRLCLVSLTQGQGVLPRLVTIIWKCIYAIRPKLLGGCRPINLLEYLDEDSWHVDHASVVSPYKISSQIVVASRLAGKKGNE